MHLTQVWSRRSIYLWTVLVLIFMYLPIFVIILASFTKSRYFRFPIKNWDLKWYEEALGSNIVQQLHITSFLIAFWVTVFSVLLGFFGALAFARYDWKGRKLFQKLLLLPIFFPQSVLGLALLLWFTFLGIIPNWQTAILAHLVWIAPIVTLIISISVYGYDTNQEDAAFDLGANRIQILREITIPALAPGLISGGLFAFLLSWVNFPLSTFTTGADSTVMEWLYGKMTVGYTPLVPALGSISVFGAIIVLFIAYVIYHKKMVANERREASSKKG